MHIKTIASAIALTTALGFGGFAYAQDAAATMALPTMIGDQELNEADAQRVKVHCDDLQTAANQAEGTEGADSEGADEPDNTAEDSQAAAGSVDLEGVTLELCIEAGFIEATP